jgi:hypothetical protein
MYGNRTGELYQQKLRGWTVAGLWKVMGVLIGLVHIIAILGSLDVGGWVTLALLIALPFSVAGPFTIAEALNRSERIENLLTRMAGSAPVANGPADKSGPVGSDPENKVFSEQY